MSRSTLLDDTGLPEDVRALVMDQLLAGVEELQLVVKKIGGKGESIAIKDEDFPVLHEAAVSVASLVAGAQFQAWAPAAIASLVMLLYTFHKNGIPLSAIQGALVRELKRRPDGLSSNGIASILNIKPEDALKELESLKAIRRNDGQVVSIVSIDASGHWRAAGV
jgi:hypothetical protein